MRRTTTGDLTYVWNINKQSKGLVNENNPLNSYNRTEANKREGGGQKNGERWDRNH